MPSLKAARGNNRVGANALALADPPCPITANYTAFAFAAFAARAFARFATSFAFAAGDSFLFAAAFLVAGFLAAGFSCCALVALIAAQRFFNRCRDTAVRLPLGAWAWISVTFSDTSLKAGTFAYAAWRHVYR